MRTLLLATLATCALPWVASPAVPLEEGFRNPPIEARIRCYWWWLNGNVTKAAITRDLEGMKSHGYAGAILVDAGGAEQNGNSKVPAGPMFGSPEWRALFRHAVQEAGRLGLEISLNIQSGWNLGGPRVRPEEAAKLLTWSRADATGPAHFGRVLDTPAHKLDFYRDIAVLAYPLRHGRAGAHAPIRQFEIKTASREMPSSSPDGSVLLTDVPAQPGEEDTAASGVQNLTSHMDAGGRLEWDVPAGEWEILRIGYAASGAKVSTASDSWQGLAIDYMDRAAMESYWEREIEPLIAGAGPLAGKALKYAVTDSWELGGINWTHTFREEFRKRRGYDPVPYLPVFAGRLVDSRETSNRFLADMRRTVADLVAYNHYAVFAALAAKHGMGIHPESGGPHGAPIDALLNLSFSAFPQMEFWATAKTHRVRDQDRFFVKQGSSAAHIYGKKMVGAEGFTSIGPQWEESIWNNLKPNFDREVCEGLNVLIWHTFTCSPAEMGKPGQEYFAGTHFNPNSTWWEQSRPFLAYMNRTQFLAQQGLFVADVLYYYGDFVPNFVRLKPSDPAHLLPGYDYDACNEDVLLNRLSVRDGRLVLPDGMSYRVLALPDLASISPAALNKIAELVRAGATVAGPKPLHSTGLKGDAEVTRLAAELWDGKRVISNRTAREVLAANGVKPDFEFVSAESGANLDYMHRRDGDAEIYFVSNQSGRAETVDATFRVSGKSPEFWMPESGEIRPGFVYRPTADGRTTVPLRLVPYGSTFVVFRKPAANHFDSLSKDGRPAWADVRQDSSRSLVLFDAEPGEWRLTAHAGAVTAVRVPPSQAPVAIAGPWTVSFVAGPGAPGSIHLDTLQSWTDSAIPGVKYFSGTAAYEKEIEIQPALLDRGRALELDLGDVRELAEVFLNGKSLGVIWKLPRTVDITSAAKPGKNQLRIEVTNLWPNRIIGDASLPQSQRYTKTNIGKFKADSPLMPSGLLGPVMLRSVVRARIGNSDSGTRSGK